MVMDMVPSPLSFSPILRERGEGVDDGEVDEDALGPPALAFAQGVVDQLVDDDASLLSYPSRPSAPSPSVRASAILSRTAPARSGSR
jgi:hypothetical protein